ncbi:hypothetical protein GCE86_26505 [Micromonospora terminaliae]|uniref:Uncharacterized protein n=1 Tax=Micromonospora terminaliae TaxID=1914461 RepID=A0AAJ3DH55_9ACTN|nr:hypothetical protein [Micromonospora terminaliae]NES26057.1 hypothetical protein [Micromonospora terminaliae]QGL50259.1 hypothetical protein GCE86_26505 [Micromonospora terminaliae]
MDEIGNELRAVVADPPPTRIDVDGLIRAEGRRRRQRTWVWSGTGAAAAAAAVLAVPALVVGGGTSRPAPAGLPSAFPAPEVSLCTGVSPKPSGPQPPLQSYGTVRVRPTETPLDGVTRLTGALREALRDGLPAGVRIESLQPGCTEPQFQFHPSYREYEAGGRLRRGEDSGFLLLQIRPTARDQTPPSCEHAVNPQDCTVVRHPDGTATVRSTLPGEPGERQLTVLALRPDGTAVLGITNNFRSGPEGSTTTAPEPLLTMDQLDELARSPGLTLYP